MTVLVPMPDRLSGTHPQTGVTVGLYPSSDPNYDIQLYRAASTKSGAGPTSVPASSKFSELATLGVINGAARVSYVDSLPLSNTLWWYKARSIRTNVATPSAFTTAVVAQAATLPTSAPGAIPWSGRPITNVLRLTTNAVLQVASSAGTTAGFFTKRLVVPAAAFRAESTTDVKNLQFTAAYLNTNGAGVVVRFLAAPVTLPPGVTVTGYSIRGYRSVTSPSVFVVLNRVQADAATGLGSAGFVSSTTGWSTLNSSAMTETVSTSRGYSLRLTIGTSVGADTVRFESATITYRMSQYHHGL